MAILFKMAKCPVCNSEIDDLKNYQSGENHYRFSLLKFNNKEVVDYELNEFQADNKINDFECPKCQAVLFTDEKEAIKFLKDEDELAEIIKEKIEK